MVIALFIFRYTIRKCTVCNFFTSYLYSVFAGYRSLSRHIAISLLHKHDDCRTLFLFLTIWDLWQARGSHCTVLRASTVTHRAPRWARASILDLLSWTWFSAAFFFFFLSIQHFSSYHLNDYELFTSLWLDGVFFSFICCQIFFFYSQKAQDYNCVFSLPWTAKTKILPVVEILQFYEEMSCYKKHISSHRGWKPQPWPGLKKWTIGNMLSVE